MRQLNVDLSELAVALEDVLLGYPRERWFAFKDEKMLERVREWLEVHDIEPIVEPPTTAAGGPTCTTISRSSPFRRR